MLAAPARREKTWDVVTSAGGRMSVRDPGFDPVLEQRGDVRECVIDCHAALLPIRERVLDPEHPSTPITRHELA